MPRKAKRNAGLKAAAHTSAPRRKSATEKPPPGKTAQEPSPDTTPDHVIEAKPSVAYQQHTQPETAGSGRDPTVRRYVARHPDESSWLKRVGSDGLSLADALDELVAAIKLTRETDVEGNYRPMGLHHMPPAPLGPQCAAVGVRINGAWNETIPGHDRKEEETDDNGWVVVKANADDSIPQSLIDYMGDDGGDVYWAVPIIPERELANQVCHLFSQVEAWTRQQIAGPDLPRSTVERLEWLSSELRRRSAALLQQRRDTGSVPVEGGLAELIQRLLRIDTPPLLSEVELKMLRAYVGSMRPLPEPPERADASLKGGDRESKTTFTGGAGSADGSGGEFRVGASGDISLEGGAPGSETVFSGGPGGGGQTGGAFEAIAGAGMADSHADERERRQKLQEILHFNDRIRAQEAPPDDLRPGKWFETATDDLLTGVALRMGAVRGVLKHSEQRAGGKWHHSIAEVKHVHSQYAALIERYVEQERAKPNKPDQT